MYCLRLASDVRSYRGRVGVRAVNARAVDTAEADTAEADTVEADAGEVGGIDTK
jgi:hypothetical protein